jgi:spore coat protein CotH
MEPENWWQSRQSPKGDPVTGVPGRPQRMSHTRLMRRIVGPLSCAALAACSSPQPAVEADATTSGAPALTATGLEPMIDAADTTSGDPTTGAGTTTGATTTGSATTSTTTGDEPATTDVTSTSTGAASTGGTTGDDTTGGPWVAKPCPEIYAQDILPTFELEISSGELAELKSEWLAADEDNIDEHPLESFKYVDIVIESASARLRGNDSHWATQGKMQLEVSFNTYDKAGRFMGLKHVLFDAAEYNKSFLRDRLALAIMRDAGLAAPCANNARVVINGQYYGLFTNIEKVDSEFLERSFEDPSGNLYKRVYSSFGWDKKTNEDDKDKSDIKALKGAGDLGELLAVMNLEQALLEWAAEAVIPDRDGLWAGGLNGYVYNDPKSGFVVIPWDLDDSFTRLEPDVDPVTFQKPPESFWGRPFYDIALADPVWFDKYIDTVDHVVTTAYQVEVLQARIDAWSAQIADAAAEDPNKPFSTGEFEDRVEEKREFVEDRAEFLAAWLQCWKDGGTSENGVCKSP